MPQSANDPLEFTGERYTPECVREIHYEHVHRYAVAARWVAGKSVLDAACGEGYGAALLARSARAVTGVDISAEAIGHASKRYRAPGLSFGVADCSRLPFAAGQFDCVVSFETLEHLEPQEQMLREFRRVLTDDGFLLISSPDKAVYTDRLHNRNAFHRRELYRPELEALLAREFPAVRLLGQKLAFHSMIWPLQPPAAATLRMQQEQADGVIDQPLPAMQAVYLLALCAARQEHLPALDAGLWLFDDAGETVYQHYQHEIRKNMAAGALLAARDEEIQALQHALQGAPARVPAASGWRRWFGIR